MFPNDRLLRAVALDTVLLFVVALLSTPHARANDRPEEMPAFPTENKDFPPSETLFVPLYATGGMIEKKLDLYASVSLSEKTLLAFGLLNGKGETMIKRRDVSLIHQELVPIYNFSQLRNPGWLFVAFSGSIKNIRATQLTTSVKVPIIDRWAILPDEANTEFTISYTLKIDSKTTCNATQVEGPNKTVEVQGETTRKQGMEYKVKWDAGGEKPGPYGIRLRAIDVNDETLFDQRDGWRQVKKR